MRCRALVPTHYGDLPSDRLREQHALLVDGVSDEVPPARELRHIVHRPHRRHCVHTRREEAPVLQLRFGWFEPGREDHVDLPAVARRDGARELVRERPEVEADVVLRVVVAARELDTGAVAVSPLKALTGPNGDARQRAAVRQEHAVQVAELPVPGSRPRGSHERED